MDDIIECKVAIAHLAKEKNNLCRLMLQKWAVLTEIARVLNVIHTITLALQKNDVNLSDFFGFWQMLELRLSTYANKPNQQTNLAQSLLDAMSARKHVLFDNPAMLVAIYLDPRYRHHIETNPEKVRLAKMTLANLWERIQMIKNDAEQTLTNTEPINVSSDTSNDDLEYLCAQLDKHYEQQGITSINSDKTETSINQSELDKTGIMLKLDEFNPTSCGFRLKSNQNVVEYWMQQQQNHPEIFELASIIFSINPTEVPIERDFSRLRHIFGENRCSLSSNRLSDILMIHLNKDLFY